MEYMLIKYFVLYFDHYIMLGALCFSPSIYFKVIMYFFFNMHILKYNPNLNIENFGNINNLQYMHARKALCAFGFSSTLIGSKTPVN